MNYMKIKQNLLLLLIGLLLGLAINAQEEPIRVETDLVTVNVSIADKQGKSVRGLQKEKFEVFDDKIKQQISLFSAEESPVSFGIVYDMHPTTDERTRTVLDSLRAFTKNLKPDDRFSIVAFNERGNLNLDFIPTIEQIKNQLNRKDPTSLYDAIYLAADKLRQGKNLKRTLLVISDSADKNSRYSFSELSKKLKSFDVQIYAVIFDESEMKNFSDITRGDKFRRIVSNDATQLDRVALEGLTIKSGGTSSFPLTANGQEPYEIYNQIASEVRESYTISFYPTITADGKWHELKIGLRSVKDSKRFALTYRQGYQSRKPFLEKGN
jgi:Ca-activated chloride channel homolog